MLYPAQVVPFLNHDDPLVRELALRYFDRCHDPGQLTADDFWAVIDARGFSPNESDALIEALGRGGAQEVGPRALAILDDPAAAEDWREIFAVQVLGEARYAPAVPVLVQRLLIDADVLNEEAIYALAR